MHLLIMTLLYSQSQHCHWMSLSQPAALQYLVTLFCLILSLLLADRVKYPPNLPHSKGQRIFTSAEKINNIWEKEKEAADEKEKRKAERERKSVALQEEKGRKREQRYVDKLSIRQQCELLLH